MRKKKSGILSFIVMVAALCVFCYSGYQLFQIWSGYHKGKSEYDQVRELAITERVDKETEEPGFEVDFDELKQINSDIVGWIRFSPEPAQISYPLVQTDNNDTYLSKTFSSNDNTVGAIFVNCYNNADFNDANTIIYGHRMRDNSMFHDLEKYNEESFWRDNPHFYIYTPDGREIAYQIYAAGVVKDVSDSYLTEFDSNESFQAFLDYTKGIGSYDTGVELKVGDQTVTLSTCTAASNDDRMVVHAVKMWEREQ